MPIVDKKHFHATGISANTAFRVAMPYSGVIGAADEQSFDIRIRTSIDTFGKTSKSLFLQRKDLVLDFCRKSLFAKRNS
jgi:hypothetical protein